MRAIKALFLLIIRMAVAAHPGGGLIALDVGQVVRIDPDGSLHVVDRSAGGWRVTAVATFGDSVFLLESSDSTNAGQRVRVLRASGTVELLGQVEI